MLSQDQLKQLPLDDLMVKLMEECAEAIQAASKIYRFGYENFHPNDINQTPNKHLLLAELHSIISITTVLHARFGESYSDWRCDNAGRG